MGGVFSLSAKHLPFPFTDIYRVKICICVFLRFAPLAESNRPERVRVCEMFTGAVCNHWLGATPPAARAPLPYRGTHGNNDGGTKNARASSGSSFYFTNKTLMLFLSWPSLIRSVLQTITVH